MPGRPPFVASVAAAAVVLLVAACGSGSSGSSDNTAAPSTVTVTQTKTVVESATTPSPTTTTAGTTATGTGTAATDTTTAVAVGAECSAADLTPTYLGSNGAAGTIELGFAVENSGSTTCHTYGWPGVSFLSASGAELPTNPTRSTTDMAGATPVLMINLKPGQQASFRLLASDFSSGGGSCVTASQLQIYAPNDTVGMHVTLAGGVPACGKTTVSPMQPGTSAYSGQ